MLSSRRRNVFPGNSPGRQELPSVLRRAAQPALGVHHHVLINGFSKAAVQAAYLCCCTREIKINP